MKSNMTERTLSLPEEMRYLLLSMPSVQIRSLRSQICTRLLSALREVASTLHSCVSTMTSLLPVQTTERVVKYTADIISHLTPIRH